MTYKPRVVLDELGARDFKPSGLSGSSSASRYAGATTSGAPTSGTFAVGDFVITQDGAVWICTTAGSPGTWTQAGGAGSYVLPAATPMVLGGVEIDQLPQSSIPLTVTTTTAVSGSTVTPVSTSSQDYVVQLHLTGAQAAAVWATITDQANFSDLKVLFQQTTELDVDIDQTTNGTWSSSNITLWFKLQRAIGASSSDTGYALQAGGASRPAPPRNLNNIYPLWDDFTGTSLDSSKWSFSVAGANGGAQTVSGGQLRVECFTNSDVRVLSQAVFPGGYQVRFRAQFQQPFASSPMYYLHGFGDSAPMIESGQWNGNTNWRVRNQSTEYVGDAVADTAFHIWGVMRDSAGNGYAWRDGGGRVAAGAPGAGANTVILGYLYDHAGATNNLVAFYDWVRVHPVAGSADPVVTAGSLSTPSPIAVTTPRLGVASGVASLDVNAHVLQQPVDDVSEAATNDTLGSASTVVNNLNRIRYQLAQLGTGAWNTLRAMVQLSPSSQQSGTINVSGEVQGSDFKAGGLNGATAASRYVGATTNGAPTSGTFAVGDFVLDQAGKLWICTIAGTPGTWGQAGNMHYRGAWSSSTTYAPNDVVTYGGATYVAMTAGSNNTPGPTGNAFTGMGSNSSMPFVIATGTTLAQTIGGFWLKINALPAARTALLEFSHPTSPATNYYRLVCGVNGHVYVEAQVLSQAAISLDVSVNPLVPGTWYWVGFGSDCPGGAVSYLGGVETLGGGSNSFTQSLTQNAGVATQSVTWVLSVGTCPSAPSLANLPSAWYMADIRVSTGNSSFAPFVRTDPVDTPSQGSPVASYAAPASTGTVGQLTDGVDARPIAGSFSVVADNPVQSVQWTVLPASLPGTASFTGEVVASDFKAVGLIGATASSRYVGATASGAPTSGTFAVGDFVIDQTAKIWVCTVAGTPGTWVQLSGGGSSTLAGDTDVSISSPHGGQVLGYSDALSKWVNQNVAGVAATQVSSKLSSAVSIGSANTFYDGPSVTLSPGTWLLTGALTVGSGDSGAYVTVKLWDGTNVLASDDGGVAFTNDRLSIPLSGVVTITTTTTFKISAAVNTLSAGASIQPATGFNSAGNTASYLNAIQLSGNPVGQTAPAVRCYNSANISVPSSTDTALTFDTNRYDQGTSTAQHSTSSNTSRLVCQQAGIYNIVGNVEWDNTTSSGQRLLAIKLNGSTVIGRSWFAVSSSSYFKPHVVSSEWYLNVGDYVELVATQDSGSTATIRNTSTDKYSPEFMMARIDSGPGAVQPNTRVQLDYALSSDTSVTAANTTWTDFISNQMFIVDDANSVIEIDVSGYILVNLTTASTRYGARLVIDSVGTTLTKMISGGEVDSGGHGNLLDGTGAVTLTGLSAGSHTVKLQAWIGGGTASNDISCLPVTNPNTDNLQIRVLERKQSVSPPSSTPAPAVQCSNSINYSIANSSETSIAFDTTDYDQGTSLPQHSTSTNTTRLTCQQTGVYLITGCVRWSGSPGSGETDLIIKINGTTAPAAWTNVGTDQRVMFISTTHYLHVGDYVELRVFQNSGGSLNIVAVADQSPIFSMTRIDTGGTGAVYVPQVKTSSYAALATDTMVVAGANSLTITLPAASSYAGKPPFVVKNDNVTSTTVARAASDLIDGATSFSLPNAYQSISLVSDAVATWRVI